MTDTEKKIAEIREALEKATPGPWFLSENGFSRKRNCPTVYAIDEELRYIAFCDDRFNFTEETPNLFNAHLIANAPEWLRFLLNELELVNRERDKLIEGLRKLAKTNAENIKEIREWKAKQNDPEVIDLDWYNYVARDILKEIGVTVE